MIARFFCAAKQAILQGARAFRPERVGGLKKRETAVTGCFRVD
jgi:hypothetical protein